MKHVIKSKFLWTAALITSLGIAGCNIFNPTENVSIKDGDAKALTYEGYIKFRNNEYTEAAHYFNKAIAADSSHSEAWLGLIKAKMNIQGLNAFEMLSYVNANRDKTVPFANLSDELALKYQVGIDTITKYTKMFFDLDDAKKLDGVITKKTVSDGYIILQMTQTMLILRKTTATMDGCSQNPANTNDCDMGTVLNTLKENPEETVEAFHEVFTACETNPSSMSTLFDQYLPGFENLKEDSQTKAVGSLCGALAKETTADSSQEDSNQAKALNIIISQFGYSNAIDDDGDGCVDEEVYDGEDNDGDGEIDEDVRDAAASIEYDNDKILLNIAAGKTEIKDLRIVKSANADEKYKTIDIDMDGKANNPEEWEFIYEKYNDRVSHNDHRFKFAAFITFNPMELPFEEYLRLKRAIAKDTDPNNIQYNLEFRKAHIGGCWVMYDEAKFKQWFKGRI